MAIFDMFSKHQKKIRGEFPDVYSYDEVPSPLRVQIIYIVRDAFEHVPYDVKGPYYESIERVLCREYGMLRLPVENSIPGIHAGGYNVARIDHEGALFEYLLRQEEIEKIIDVIELFFRFMHKYTTPAAEHSAIQDLNSRFKEHGVGYYFANGEIIRIDSQYLHSKAVKPALGLLDRKRYAGAQAEFMQAHKHYRNGNGKEAINECLKAFESVMKSICNEREWRYDEKAGASKLIGICFDNGLVPAYWRSHFDALRSTLESGAPTARNRLSGHGQGETPTAVPAHIVGYVLHMTAAAIVFLAEAEASDGR